MQIGVMLAMLMAVMVSEMPTDELLRLRLGAAGLGSGPAVMLAGGTVLIWWSLMRTFSKMVLGKMQRMGWYAKNIWRLPSRTDVLCQVMALSVFGFLLTGGGWAIFVNTVFKSRHLAGVWEAVVVLPYVIMTVIRWHSFYPVNRYVREYIVVGQLAEGLSARPVWSLNQYLSFQIRNGLLILLVPILVIFAMRDVFEMVIVRYYPEALAEGLLVELLTLGGAGVVFLFSPFMLRMIWKTRSLPVGPLRAMLEGDCRRLRLGARDILLWDTSGMVANAAVMGILGPVRYILLTDSLIENTRDEHIEAVFGHEAGHIRHHHIFYLVLFVIGSTGLGSLAAGPIERAVSDYLNGQGIQNGAIEWVLAVSSAIGFGVWLLLFGWVSRRFERQADVFSAQCCQASQARRRGEAEDESVAGSGDTLSPAAAEATAGALERIAMLNGISVEAKSWRHSSIGSRMVFLRSLAGKEGGLRDFERGIKYLKSVIGLAALSAAAIYMAQYMTPMR